MFNQQCWVIKNKDGNYVNSDFRALFTGITTGFTGYTNEETMKKDLEMLGQEYYSEYINLKDVPKGKRVYRD